MATLHRTTRRTDFAPILAAREPFANGTGSLTGAPGGGHPDASGWLAGNDLFAWQHDARDVEYVVRSYATPIAWLRADGTWYEVAQKFSRTTSCHQGLIGVGIMRHRASIAAWMAPIIASDTQGILSEAVA